MVYKCLYLKSNLLDYINYLLLQIPKTSISLGLNSGSIFRAKKCFVGSKAFFLRRFLNNYDYRYNMWADIKKH